MDLSYEILLEHLFSICGMANIFKTLCGISTSLFKQNLISTWMLKRTKFEKEEQTENDHSILRYRELHAFKIFLTEEKFIFHFTIK